MEGCKDDLLSRNGIERILPYLLHIPLDKLATDSVVRSIFSALSMQGSIANLFAPFIGALALDIDQLLEKAMNKSTVIPSRLQQVKVPFEHVQTLPPVVLFCSITAH